jgi:hypothetical protein
MGNEEKLRSLLAEARRYVEKDCDLGFRNRACREGRCDHLALQDRIDAALAEPLQSEADAFKRGVTAMRKAAVARCDEMAADFRRRRTRNDEFKGMGAELCAAAIETVKGLPDPEDKP